VELVISIIEITKYVGGKDVEKSFKLCSSSQDEHCY